MEEQQRPQGKRKVRHSKEYIDSIIKLATLDGIPVHQVAEQSGLCSSQIYRWINKQKLEIARQDPASDVSVQAELRDVRRENEYLKKQLEFLKKAATYFASQSSSDSLSSGNTSGSTR